MDKVNYKSTGLYIKPEEEKFKAIIFLSCVDDTRYDNLLYQLKDGSHFGWGKYPLTLSINYALLVRYSGQIDHNRRLKGGQRGSIY